MGLLAEARAKKAGKQPEVSPSSGSIGLLAEARARNEDAPRIESEMAQAFSGGVAHQIQPGVVAASPRAARAASIRSERLATEEGLRRYKAGELTSADVSQEEMDRIRLARIAEIPEITGSFRNLSKNLGFVQALAGMTAFDDEFGKILQSADPDIGVVTTPEGERIAVNRATSEAMSINKVGPSLMDAIQIGGAASIFSPSGALQGVGRQALGAAGTQALIEAGQAAAGGEFDVEDVAIAGAAVPVVAGAIKYGKGAIENFRRSVRSGTNLIDQATGVPVPQFQKAMDKYNLDFGDLVEDPSKIPVIYSADTPDQVVENIIKKQLKTDKKNAYLSRLRLDHKGNIVDDDLGKEAVRQGFQPSDVASIKSANLPTRKAAQKMLRMQRAIIADKSNVDKFRPSDIAGDAVMDRFNFVRSEADKLAGHLDRIASKELTVSGRKLISGPGQSRLKGIEIDPTRIEQAVKDGLEKLNVQGLDDLKEPIFKAIENKNFFDGSMIMEDKTSQKIIRSVFRLLQHDPGGPVDALHAHNLKRQLDAMIDFNRKSAGGLTDAGKGFAKNIRHNLNESIRDVSPRYAEINDKLSSAINALNGIEDSISGRINLFEPNANQALGTDLRKLLSNYGTRQTLNNSLNTLDDVASQLGGTFGTDYRELNRLANVLDKRFGSVADNSFAGNITAALDLNRLRSTSVKEFAIEKGFEKLQAMRGLNDKKAMDALNELIVRGK